MKLIYCLMVMLCLYSKHYGQTDKVAVNGSRIPDIYFKNILNYTKPTGYLRGFAKKIVLIDFWTTTCGACLQKMPALDSMQRVHSGELAVLLVSSSKADTKERAWRALNRVKENRGYTVKLPVILEDTLLNQLLPHSSVPHFAILDSNLQLLGAADGDYLTPALLDNIIKTGKADFGPESRLKDINSEQVFFNDATQGLTGIITQSTMSRYMPGLPWSSYITKDSNGMVTRVLLTNNSIPELLNRAYHYFDYPGIVYWPPGIKAPPDLPDRTADWIKANSFTYQLICEPIPYDSARRILQLEIQRLFGYTATVGCSPAFRYVLKAREGFKNDEPLIAIEAAESADILALSRYLSRKYRIELDTKLPLNICSNINIASLAGKDLAACEALLNQRGFYFKREAVEKRALFIHHPLN